MALFVALGGTSYAAAKLPKNSVGTSQIKKNGVRSADVKNRSLKKVDFKKGQLPQGEQGPQGPQGPQGQPGQNGQNGVIGNVTVQRTDVALPDNSTVAAEATCPTGQKAISGGASVAETSSNDIKMMVSRPGNGGLNPNDGEQFANTWRSVYRNPAGGTGAATIRAYVLCVEDPAA
jgi:hypothetical protein